MTRSTWFARALIALGMVGLLVVLVKPRRRRVPVSFRTRSSTPLQERLPVGDDLRVVPWGEHTGSPLQTTIRQQRLQTASTREVRAHPRAAWIAWLLMAASAFFFRPGGAPIIVPLGVGVLNFLNADQLTFSPLLPALICLLGGAALLARSSRVLTPQPPLHVMERGQEGEGKTCCVPLSLGIGLLGMLLAVNHASPQINVSFHLQALMFVAGVGLSVWGLGGFRPRPHASPNSGRGEGEGGGRREMLLLGGIVLLALVVRVWALDSAIRIWVDEQLISTPTIQLFRNPFGRILHPMGQYMPYPYLFAYVEWWTVTLFGRTYVGLRLVSALVGTLTIPALYLLARTLFDRTTALVAAALLATFPLHVHFSRFAIINIADPLFGTLTLAFLARGLRSNRRLDYALAGAMLGMTQYFYEGGRLFYPALALAWVLGLALLRQHAFTTATRRGLLVLIAAALIVAAPLLVSNALLADSLRFRTNSELRPMEYWTHLLDGDNAVNHLRVTAETFLKYVHLADSAGWYDYGSGTALVLVPLVPALLVGAALLAAALWRTQSAGALLALLWMALTSLANTALNDPVNAARYVVAVPALALIPAVGLRYGLTPLTPRLPLPHKWGEGEKSFLKSRFSGLLLAVIVAGLMVAQVGYYFGAHVPLFNAHARGSAPPDGVDALWRARDFPPNTQIHLVSHDKAFGEEVLQFIRDDLQVNAMRTEDFTRAYLDALPRTVDHAFFLEVGDIKSYYLVQETFAVQPPQYTPYDLPVEKAFVLYYAPRAQAGSESP